jgi:prephenate dehydrogenase
MTPRFKPSLEQDPQILILGDEGRMVQCIVPYFTGSVIGLDLKRFGDRRLVRRALKGHIHPMKTTPGSGLKGVVVVNLPPETYYEAYETPGSRARLQNLLGIAGAGQAQTGIVYTASVLTPPARGLEAISGLVLGLHQLHGPQVRDFSQQTALVAVTPEKRKHHLYREVRQWLDELLNNAGYGNITELEPERHDQLMANVQFLAHSAFLVAAGIAKTAGPGETYHAESYPAFFRDVLEISQRILTLKPEIYCGIALGNPVNKVLFALWQRALTGASQRTPVEAMWQLLRRTRDVAEEDFSQSNIGRRTRKVVRTPVSAVREALLNALPDFAGEMHQYRAGPIGGYLDRALDEYRHALTNASAYLRYFRELQGFFPDRDAEQSSRVIQQYSGMVA